jgi:hypothetical protein
MIAVVADVLLQTAAIAIVVDRFALQRQFGLRKLCSW